MIKIISEDSELEATLYVLLGFIQKSLDTKTPINLSIKVDSVDKVMNIMDGRTDFRDSVLFSNINLANPNLTFHI